MIWSVTGRVHRYYPVRPAAASVGLVMNSVPFRKYTFYIWHSIY